MSARADSALPGDLAMNAAATRKKPVAHSPRPLLITGFEPFGGDAINPSWEVAQALHGEWVGGVPLVACRLPTTFEMAPQVLAQALRRHRPLAVIALGLAAGRCAVSVERVAINLIDARIADNGGAQPLDVPVLAKAPAAYFASLPLKAIVAGLRAQQLPAEVSHSAGTYVCNQVFYRLMHALRRRPGVRAGFIHLPSLPGPGVDSMAALALARQVAAIRLAAQITLCQRGDLAVSEGTVA